MTSGRWWRPRGITARLYLFSLAQVFGIALVIPWLVRVTVRPPMGAPDLAALSNHVLAAVAAHTDDRIGLTRELDRIKADLHGEVSIYGDQDQLVATNTTPALSPPVALTNDGPGAGRAPPPLAPPPFPWPPTARGLSPPLVPHPPRMGPGGMGPGSPWSDPPRFVMPLPARVGGYAVYRMRAPAPPWVPLAVWAVAVIVAGCAVFSVLLARSFSAPLAKLAATARAFGEGDLGVRAGVTRRDEFGEVGRTFDAMADRVEGLIRSQQDLLANVSHELRTPLARMRVALDLAAEGDSAMARESLGEIAHDLDELEQLVGDVLANGRLVGADRNWSAAVLRREHVPVADLVSRATSRFSTHHSRRALEVEMDADVLRATISVDVALLRRALDNLLDNAVKYSDEASTITLRARLSADSVILIIEDHGIGIEAVDLAKVGTPFFRTDQSRSRTTGGVGLGLSLARRIVEAHGGVVDIASEPLVGTTLHITLPRTSGPSAVRAASDEEALARRGSTD